MTWQSIDYLNLLWLLPAVAAFFLFAAHRRRVLLSRLAHPTRQAILTQTAPSHARLASAILLILTLAAMAIALARPAWNKTTQPFQSRGRDVVFVLDISRSMLAAHRGTTRLEEAKFAIQECLQSIRGDRVALVIFAGNAKVACPLTHDTAFFLSRLNDVDHRSVTFGGTMLGDAIRLVCNAVFKGTSDLYRDVIVITDGEDMQSNPIQAAEQLAAYNARLIAVGMGDATPTPLVIQNAAATTETITDNGKPVMTRLDADTLRKMTAATPGGLLIPVPSDTLLNLNDIYARYIQLQEKKDFGTRSIVTYEEKFQLFALLAAALLLAARLLPRRRRLPAPQTLALLAALLSLQPALAQSTAPSVPTTTPPANTTSPDDLIRQASRLLQHNQPQQADKLLEQALAIVPDNPYANFNCAVAHFRQDRLTDALAAFQRTLQLAQAQPKPDPALILNTRLAIAETAHQLAKPQNDHDTSNSPEHLEQAIQNARLAVNAFQDALHDNPQRRQTKDDLETAKLNFKTLRQLQKQLQQQQQQQQQSDQQKQQDQKDAEQKDQQSAQQKDQQSAEQKDQQSAEQKDQQSAQQKDQQQALKNLEQQQRQAAKDLQNQQKSDDELKQQQQQLEQQTQQTLNQQPDNQFLRQSLAKQQEAQQKLDQNDRQQAQKAQKEAADLTRMAQRQPPKEPETPQQPETPPPDEQPAQPELPQPQSLQDARSLDAINQENLNRQNRRQHRFSVPSPRAQDW